MPTFTPTGWRGCAGIKPVVFCASEPARVRGAGFTVGATDRSPLFPIAKGSISNDPKILK